jgi:hypothetical protein
MVEPQPSKLVMPVRSRSPAPLRRRRSAAPHLGRCRDRGDITSRTRATGRDHVVNCPHYCSDSDSGCITCYICATHGAVILGSPFSRSRPPLARTRHPAGGRAGTKPAYGPRATRSARWAGACRSAPRISVVAGRAVRAAASARIWTARRATHHQPSGLFSIGVV